MKTVVLKDGSVVRMSNKDAILSVKGGASYCPKSKYKSLKPSEKKEVVVTPENTEVITDKKQRWKKGKKNQAEEKA